MIALLRSRKSVRKYTDTPLDNQVISILRESLLLSPSSRGINPWEFVFVTDRMLLKELSNAKEHGSEFLCGAPCAIVVCADESKSDVWVEDCSIASIIVQLSATSIGLGSCWIQIRNRKCADGQTSEAFVQKLLNIPSHVKVESIIAVGYSAEKTDADNNLEKKLNTDKIHFESY